MLLLRHRDTLRLLRSPLCTHHSGVYPINANFYIVYHEPAVPAVRYCLKASMMSRHWQQLVPHRLLSFGSALLL